MGDEVRSGSLEVGSPEHELDWRRGSGIRWVRDDHVLGEVNRGFEVAMRTLWYAIVQSLRVVSPVMPFLTDHLWRNLTAPAGGAIDTGGAVIDVNGSSSKTIASPFSEIRRP